MVVDAPVGAVEPDDEVVPDDEVDDEVGPDDEVDDEVDVGTDVEVEVEVDVVVDAEVEVDVDEPGRWWCEVDVVAGAAWESECDEENEPVELPGPPVEPVAGGTAAVGSGAVTPDDGGRLADDVTGRDAGPGGAGLAAEGGRTVTATWVPEGVPPSVTSWDPLPPGRSWMSPSGESSVTTDAT